MAQLGIRPKYVKIVNTLSTPTGISHPFLPNGAIEVAPGEVVSVPSETWMVKFRQSGLRRATPEQEAEWLARKAGEVATAEGSDSIAELEETRLDALKERAAELGLNLKGNKAAVCLQLRCGLLTRQVADHNASVLETIAQGAYEFDRAERMKTQGYIESWKDATDEDRLTAILAAGLILKGVGVDSEPTPFNEAAGLLIAALTDQPTEAVEGATNEV